MVNRALSLALFVQCAFAQGFQVYVGSIEPKSVIIAWGRTVGAGNIIGRTSASYGRATVKVGDQSTETDKNWAEVKGLSPDTQYDYEVRIGGNKIGDGKVRTWPEKADRLCFFVIGDFGTGGSHQQRVAGAMWQEFQRRAATDNPVRFVITVGDNIYADVNLGRLILRSGDEDLHWRRKFFEPYREILRQVPWYPTLGNHDGNETENRGDLSVYLDNFLFPDGKSHRWYNFSYGGLAEFFALDSSENSEQGVPAPVFGEDGEQFRWLKKQLPDSKAPWKIPYFHHPPFTAGPFHGASYATLKHFVDLFGSSGVKVAFNGHEHNLQFSARNAATRDVLYVISGAGGELRRGDVTANMERANMAAWAPQRHFLAVEIEGRTMAIQPVSYEPVTVFDRNRRKVEMPATISLDAGATLHSAAQASPPE